MRAGMDNRWIVTLNGDEAREYLLHHGLTLFNKKIKLRRYDDVLNDEYVEYLEYEQLQKSLYSQRQQMTSSTGDDELTVPELAEEQQDDDSLPVVDAHRGPPTTAVNTPEPPQAAF